MRAWCRGRQLKWIEPKTTSRTPWQGILDILDFVSVAKKAIMHFLSNYDCPPQKLDGKARLLFREVVDICNKEALWPSVDFFKALFAPLLEVTIKLEADKPVMSAVYPAFNRLKEAVHNLKIPPIVVNELHVTPTWLHDRIRMAQSSRYEEVVLDHPLTLIAYLEDPYERAKWNSPLTPTEWTAVQRYLLNRQANMEPPLPADWAINIARELRKLADNLAEYNIHGHWQLAIPKEAWGEALYQWQRQYAKLTRQGAKDKDTRWQFLKASSWWSANSIGHDPDLAVLMKRALSIRISTGPAERNWSAFGIVHTKKRNRMSAKRAGQLTKLFWNRRVREPDSLVESLDMLPPDPVTILQHH
jgi:hypothetical protein